MSGFQRYPHRLLSSCEMSRKKLGSDQASVLNNYTTSISIGYCFDQAKIITKKNQPEKNNAENDQRTWIDDA